MPEGTSFYHEVEALVSAGCGFHCSNRRKEITISRIRLGRNHLDYYLKRYGKHPTGRCDLCQKEYETTEHFLLQCPKQEDLRKQIIENGISLELKHLLEEQVSQDLIFKWILKHKIDI